MLWSDVYVTQLSCLQCCMAVSRSLGLTLLANYQSVQLGHKTLLDVRKSIHKHLFYANVVYPSVPDQVRLKQHRFFSKMPRERHGQADDSLMSIINVAMQAYNSTVALISDSLATNAPNIQSPLLKAHERISLSTGSRCVAYRMINPTFVLHGLYRNCQIINDHFRIWFSEYALPGFVCQDRLM